MAETYRDAFTGKLQQGLDRLEIELAGESVERLHRYFLELKKWSGKVNLIAKGSGDEQIIESHFLDSLTLLPLLQGEGVHLLDIGTGGGFPGLVLKAARPEMRITLVEPRLKRVSFLKHVARTLQLPDVTVLACRIEDEVALAGDTDFTHITSRAVSDIAGFLEMACRFTNPGLQFICMKGPKWREELAAGSMVLQRLAFVQRECLTRELPFSKAERTLLVFVRENEICQAG